MNKKEFLSVLGKGLKRLPNEEQDKWLDFYAEMIDDRMEEGIAEEEAVAAIGTPEQIIEQILPQSKPAKKKRELKTWQLVLLIVGSPLWLSLVIAAAAVVLALMVSAWAVVIAFYASAVSMVASGVAVAVCAPMYMAQGYVDSGLFQLGAGLFSTGLGVLWFMGTNRVAKGTVWLCKKLFACLPGKEVAE